MKWITDDSLSNFPFLAGAKENVAKLSVKELQYIEDFLDELYDVTLIDTQINDLFWFEFDTVCQWLGYADEDDFINNHE